VIAVPVVIREAGDMPSIFLIVAGTMN